jgi:hypothetical protein
VTKDTPRTVRVVDPNPHLDQARLSVGRLFEIARQPGKGPTIAALRSACLFVLDLGIRREKQPSSIEHDGAGGLILGNPRGKNKAPLKLDAKGNLRIPKGADEIAQMVDEGSAVRVEGGEGE